MQSAEKIFSFNSFGNSPPFSYKNALNGITQGMSQASLAENFGNSTDRIYDCSLEILQKDMFGPHKGGVWRILPMGQNEIASASYDHNARIFNTDDYNQTIFPNPKILSSHKREVLSLVLQDEKTLVTGSSDGQMFFWDTDTAKNVDVIRENKQNCTGFYSMALLDCKRIATGACQKPKKVKENQIWNHNIKIWSLDKKNLLTELKGHGGGISSLVTIGDRLVSASADKTIRVWNVTESTCLDMIKTHDDYVYSIASICNNQIVSGSRDRTAQIWDIEANKKIGSLKSLNSEIAHESTIYDVASFEDQLILTGSRDGFVKVWDQRTLSRISTLDAEDGFVYSVAALPNGKIAAGTAGIALENNKQEGSVVVWEFQK